MATTDSGTIALLLALAGNRNVAVPLSRDVAAHHDAFRGLSRLRAHISGWDCVRKTGVSPSHEYTAPPAARQPGLVLFTSGSTGVNKAAVMISRHCSTNSGRRDRVSDARVSSG
jgi:acyl-coenzyme A synthetase/AMP-(fatty) acid ligase